MSSIKNITKTKYDKISKDPLSLCEYITFSLDDDSKYTIFKFYNSINQRVKQFRMEISEIDDAGFTLKKSILKLDTNLPPSDYGVPKAKVAIEKDTVRLEVNVIEVVYERLVWKNNEFEALPYTKEDFKKDSYNDRVGVTKSQNEVVDKAIKQKNGKNKVKVLNITKRNKPKKVFVLSIIMTILLIAAIIGGAFYFKSQNHEFYDGEFQYKVVSEEDKTCEVVDFDSNKENVTIKDKIDDYTIVSIKSGVFENSKIKTLTIESALTVEEEAFKKSLELKIIYINGSGTTIEKNAFEGCKNLQTLNISGVTRIYENAFLNCSSLKKVEAPNATIYKDAFKGCSNIETIIYNDSASGINFIDMFGSGINIVNVTTYKNYISKSYFSGIYTISYFNAPNATIEYGALSGQSLSSYTIRNNIEVYKNKVKIADGATSFVIDDGFTYEQIYYILNDENFISACKTLTISNYDCYLDVEIINKFINLEDLTIKKCHFYKSNDNNILSNPKLSKLSINANIASMIDSAPYVTDLTINDNGSLNITYLSGFSSLESISMPINSYYTLSELGLYKGVKTINLTSNGTYTTIPANFVDGYYNIEELTIPSNINQINGVVVSNCQNLKKLVIPNSVSSITNTTLIGEGCDSLAYVSVPFVGSNSNSSTSYSTFNQSYSATRILIITDNTYGGYNFSSGLENVVYLSFNGNISNKSRLLNNCSNLKYLNLSNQTITSSLSTYSLNLEWLFLENATLNYNLNMYAKNISIESSSYYNSYIYNLLYKSSATLYIKEAQTTTINYSKVYYGSTVTFESLITY